MKHQIDTSPKPTTAILVALATPKQSLLQTEEHVEELLSLCQTLGIEVIHTFIQHLERSNPQTRVGKGKVEEIKAFADAESIDKIIFDDALSPAQVKNLTSLLKRPVVDRNVIILEIFAMHAQTKQAKIQIEIAQYQYLLPRLTKMWGHLSRQQGGVSGMRGPGEKELETDRRIIQEKIKLLRTKLRDIHQQNLTQRKNRKKKVNVTLVGYTNVGKSTLMQLLSKHPTYAEDKLFATITSTVSKVMIKNIPYLLTDTIGFIRKLPHHLIASFQSTLDEIREADLLLHVVDVSHPAYKDHIQVVNATLQEIGAAHIPTILVLNKADKLISQPSGERTDLLDNEAQKICEAHATTYGQPAVMISAKNNLNVPALQEVLYQHIVTKHLLIYPNYLTSTEDYAVASAEV